MKQIWDFIQGQLLGMKWLNELISRLLTACGLDVEVEYITDLSKVMEYGVMSMPALVVNEKVVSMGKILSASEVKEKLI